MPDHARMYAILCAAASDAVDVLELDQGAALARRLLLDALDQAESLYVDEEATQKPCSLD